MSSLVGNTMSTVSRVAGQFAGKGRGEHHDGGKDSSCSKESGRNGDKGKARVVVTSDDGLGGGVSSRLS